ncbi:hypothetical protein YC2023_050095 [Brassica napus]
MKDIPKFTDNVNFGSPNTQESNVAGSPTSQSPGLSSFSINLSSDDGGSNSSQRPIGSKKAKLKRKSQKHLAAIQRRVRNCCRSTRESMERRIARISMSYKEEENQRWITEKQTI